VNFTAQPVGEIEVFVIQSISMDDTPLTKRPWFYISAWLVILLALYGWQISRMGGVQASLYYILLDLACIFPVLLVIWMAFFAQFVLPVRTFRDRQKIFDRLLTDLFGGHGPALFIENGEIKEHSGERLKTGPGVVWLDSASAAVTRTATSIKQILGPGVHFIDKGEIIAGTVDLHTQIQSLGPKESENPFAEQTEEQTNEEYQQIQDRRKMVSALTRDGIEVIPKVSVVFRVDTGFPKEDEPGSRFGYRTGITRKAKENEEKDKETIRKAIIGQGINLNALPDSPRRRLAWNELPAALAVDVWREYVAKFTLDELFNPGQDPIPAPPSTHQPMDVDGDPLSQPVLSTTNQVTLQDRFAQILREINIIISNLLRRIENATNEKKPVPPLAIIAQKAEASIKPEPDKVTALQVINDMVNMRLKNEFVPNIDDHGNLDSNDVQSHEYKLLSNRGIKVLSVGIGNLLVKKEIEDKVIERWSAAWYKNAKAEEKQIERRQNILRSASQEKAIRQYADLLSNELNRKKPNDIRGSLKVLLMRTRTIILNNDQLRKDMSKELQSLEDILRWVESNE